MGQPASFKKLKEQIEAAKRDLSEVSNAETVNTSPSEGHEGDLAPISEKNSAEIEESKVSLGDTLPGDAGCAKVVNMSSETVVTKTPIDEHTFDSHGNEMASEFQFFHRTAQPKDSTNQILDKTLEKAGNVDSEAEVLLFSRLDCKLTVLERGVAQNRKHILDLLSLLSQLDLGQAPVNKNPQPSRRLNRRYMFWFVIGFLALAWFGLTPSGHTTIQHFLAFI